MTVTTEPAEAAIQTEGESQTMGCLEYLARPTRPEMKTRPVFVLLRTTLQLRLIFKSQSILFSLCVCVNGSPLFKDVTPHGDIRFQESAGGYSHAGATPI